MGDKSHQDPLPATSQPNNSISDQENAKDPYVSVHTSTSGDDASDKPRGGLVSWLKRKWSDWWINELLSTLLGFASLAAIVIILRIYDQKPLSQWSVAISLNTYVAIFTTLAKFGLIFPTVSCLAQLKWVWFARRDAPIHDFAKYQEAAQGPWAALQLLGRLRCWHLGSIGALVTILAVGISPITQQTVSYLSRRVPIVSSLPCQVPSSNLWGAVVGGERGDPFSGTLPVSMQQAIYSGLWSSNTSSIEEIAPSCSTGNCTYPDFDSLAVCYKVANVTHKLKVTSGESGFNPYNATLPNGVNLEYGALMTQINATDKLLMGTEGVGMHIAAFDIVYQTGNEPFNDVNSTFNALEAAFWWCVNRYKTEVVNGQATTTVVATSTNYSGNNGTFQYFDWNLTAPSGDKNFSINNPASGVLQQFMSSKLDGHYVGAFPGNPYEQPLGDIALIVQPLLNAETPALVVEGLTNFTRNIANSLTNSVRTHQGYSGELGATFIEGTAFAMETFIQVQWAWLSLLVGLAFVSLIFLVATILQSTFAKVQVMRSDPLAVLTVLDAEARARMGPTAVRVVSDSREKEAHDLKVRLRKREGGWTLDTVN